MIIYILFYIIIFLLSLKVKPKKYTFIDYLILILMVLFSGLRACGTDYFLYKFFYELINETTVAASRTGIGFTYLRIFFHNVLHLDYQFLILFVSAVTNLCIYKFIKEKSNKPGLALLCYISFGFYTNSFNMFRQMMSISLVLIGTLYWEKGNKLISIIFYIFGFLLHSVSLVGIIIYSLDKFFRMIKLDPIIVIIIFIIFYLTYDKFFDLIMNFIPSLSIYKNRDYIPGLGTYLIIIVNCIIFVFLSLFKKKIVDSDSMINKYFNYFAIAIIISSFQLKNYLFMRIVVYFSIFMPLLIAEFYEKLNINNNKIISFLLYITIFVYFLIYTNSFGGVVPYHFFFNR